MAAYIDTAYLRANGIATAMVSDADAPAVIAMWQAFIERATRLFFDVRTATVQLDGSGSDTLFLRVPLVAVTELYLNRSTTVLDPSYYEAYTQRNAIHDDRKNPKIRLRNEAVRDIYTAPDRYGRLLFDTGRRNQKIVGSWGYVEEDNTTPVLIKRAVLLCIAEKVATPVAPGSTGTPVPPVLGAILEEETDDHRVRYAQPGGTSKARPGGLEGIIQNREVLDIIKLYKAPMGLGAPSDFTWR